MQAAHPHVYKQSAPLRMQKQEALVRMEKQEAPFRIEKQKAPLRKEMQERALDQGGKGPVPIQSILPWSAAITLNPDSSGYPKRSSRRR